MPDAPPDPVLVSPQAGFLPWVRRVVDDRTPRDDARVVRVHAFADRWRRLIEARESLFLLDSAAAEVLAEEEAGGGFGYTVFRPVVAPRESAQQTPNKESGFDGVSGHPPPPQP